MDQGIGNHEQNLNQIQGPFTTQTVPYNDRMQAPPDIARFAAQWERRIHEANAYWERIVAQTATARELANSGQMSQEDWAVHYHTYRFHEHKMGELVDQYEAFYERWPQLRPQPGQPLPDGDGPAIELDPMKKAGLLALAAVAILGAVFVLFIMVVKPLLDTGSDAVGSAKDKVTTVTSPSSLDIEQMGPNVGARINVNESVAKVKDELENVVMVRDVSHIQAGSTIELVFSDASMTIYVARHDSVEAAKETYKTLDFFVSDVDTISFTSKNADDFASDTHKSVMRKGSSIILLRCGVMPCAVAQQRSVLTEIDRQLSLEAKVQNQVRQ